MGCRNLLSLLSTVVTADSRRESRDEILRLKRMLAKERRVFSDRSSNIARILSSRLTQKLSVEQVGKLKAAKEEADSFVKTFRILEKELEEQRRQNRRRLLKLLPTRIVILFLLYLIMASIFDVAKHDWTLAVGALLLTGLYIYVYKFMENEYIWPLIVRVKNERLFPLFVYLNRLLFFMLFLYLEVIVLINWELLKLESGQAVLVPISLGFLAALYLELANLPKAFSFRIEWPENQFWRDVIYAFYLYPMLYVFIHIIFYAFSAGEEVHSFKPLGDLASGVVVASTLTALANIYFVRVKAGSSKIRR